MKMKCGHPFFALHGDKPPGPNGFPVAFCQLFWNITKADIMEFLREFHTISKVPNNLGTSFIALISKNERVDCLKDFTPINLIGSLYKILA